MNKTKLFLCLTLLSLSAVCPAASMSSRDQWQQRDRVIRDFNFKEGDVVADIGAGRGYFSFHLAKVVGEKGKIYATEISEKVIKPLADKVKKDGIKNIEPVVSEPTSTKLPDTCLDGAIIVNVLHHVPKDKRMDLTRDIVRSIKPGGTLFVLDWKVKADIKHDKTRRIPREELIKYATDNGLKLDAEFFYLKNQVFLRFKKPEKTKETKSRPEGEVI